MFCVRRIRTVIMRALDLVIATSIIGSTLRQPPTWSGWSSCWSSLLLFLGPSFSCRLLQFVSQCEEGGVEFNAVVEWFGLEPCWSCLQHESWVFRLGLKSTTCPVSDISPICAIYVSWFHAFWLQIYVRTFLTSDFWCFANVVTVAFITIEARFLFILKRVIWLHHLAAQCFCWFVCDSDAVLGQHVSCALNDSPDVAYRILLLRRIGLCRCGPLVFFCRY